MVARTFLINWFQSGMLTLTIIMIGAEYLCKVINILLTMLVVMPGIINFGISITNGSL